MSAALRRPCPACGAVEAELLFAQRFERIEGVSILDGYEAVACAGCGYCFAHDVPPQGAFDAYYAAASKYDNAGAIPEHDRRRFAAIAADVERFVPDRGARIHELGCATGGLLAALRERGYRRLSGREPSPTCASAARDRLGLDVREGSLFGGDEPGAPFDAVILVGVLEHLVDVPGAMLRLRSLLAPGGLAIIEVPDALAFSELLEAPFQQFSVEHVGYFSAASMANLLGAHGFAEVAALRRGRPIVHGVDPVVTGVYRSLGVTRTPVAERGTAGAIARYVERCAADDRSLGERLGALVGRGCPFVVWGCGTLTLRLLASSPLRELPVAAFIDGNPLYHGHRVRGVPIEAPGALSRHDAPVLVCSFGSGPAIARSIRERYGDGREVVTLTDAA